MSIMGSIYTNPSELGSDYWKERAETYLHDQELYQKECDTLRQQLDVAVEIIKAVIHGDDVREDDYVSLHYAIVDAREFLAEISRTGGVK